LSARGIKGRKKRSRKANGEKNEIAEKTTEKGVHEKEKKGKQMPLDLLQEMELNNGPIHDDEIVVHVVGKKKREKKENREILTEEKWRNENYQKGALTNKQTKIIFLLMKEIETFIEKDEKSKEMLIEIGTHSASLAGENACRVTEKAGELAMATRGGLAEPCSASSPGSGDLDRRCGECIGRADSEPDRTAGESPLTVSRLSESYSSAGSSEFAISKLGEAAPEPRSTGSDEAARPRVLDTGANTPDENGECECEN
jgi:hypothetical protein